MAFIEPRGSDDVKKQQIEEEKEPAGDFELSHNAVRAAMLVVSVSMATTALEASTV